MEEDYQQPMVEDEEEVGDEIVPGGEVRVETPATDERMSVTQETGGSYTSHESKWESPSFKQMIVLKDAMGRKLNFPFSICKTWHGMEHLVQQAMLHVDSIEDHVRAGHYDLLGPDGSIILPAVWEQSVEPGWFVTMRMWKDAEDDLKQGQKAVKQGRDKPPIRFKDCVGRMFTFPFRMCQTWTGMEELIKQAFIHVDVIGPHVQARHYDLLGPDQEIILPQVWDKIIEPDWAITMVMWPMDRQPSGMPQHRNLSMPGLNPGMRPGMPPGVRPDMRPGMRPGMRPDARAGPFHGHPPPPPPGLIHPGIAAHMRRMGRQRPDIPTRGVQMNGSGHLDIQQKKEKHSDLGAWLFGNADPGIKHQKTTDGTFGTGLASLDDNFDLPLAESNTKGEPPEGARPNHPVPWDAEIHKDRPGRKTARGAAASVEGRASPPIRETQTSETDTSSDSDETDSAELKAQELLDRALIVLYKHKDNSPQPLISTAGIPHMRLEINAASIYWQLSSMSAPATLDLAVSTKVVTPPNTGLSAEQNISTQMRWIHVARPYMSFRDFEAIALDQLCPDASLVQIVRYLVNTLKHQRKDDEWTLKPGTVLRCDTGAENEPFRSACFVSLPTLHSSIIDGPIFTNDDEICRERKLHEALDLPEPDSENFSSFAIGPGGNATRFFWVRQSWILITSAGVLTYSSHQQDVLRGTTITIQKDVLLGDDGEQMIQMVDKHRRLFYLSAKKCKSFNELKRSARKELIKAGALKRRDTEIKIKFFDRQVLTAMKWTTFVKLAQFPTLQIWHQSVETSDSDGVDGSSDQNYSSSYSTDDEEISDNHSISSGETTNMIKKDKDGFLLLSSESALNAPYLGLLDLNEKVPPFLSWLSEAKPGQDRNSSKGFREGTRRTEAKIVRRDDEPLIEDLMEELYHALGGKNTYHETAELSFGDFEVATKSHYNNKDSLNRGTTSNLPPDVPPDMAKEYFDTSLRVLESFLSPMFSSSLVAKYLFALTMVMKDPRRELSREEPSETMDGPEPSSASSQDPALSEIPGQDPPTAWVISRTRIQEDRIQDRSPAGDQGKCWECEQGTIYNSVEKATDHLRQYHLVGSTTDTRLRTYAIPVASALSEWRQEYQHNLLRQSRNDMHAILKRLVYIQNDVVSDGVFQEQRGLPQQLIDSFRWIVVYVCTVPHIFHQITELYNVDLSHKYSECLATTRTTEQMGLLSQVRIEAEDQIQQAEELLTSPESLATRHAPENFLISVGPHCLASHIVSNLLRMPLFNQKHGPDLYESYANNLQSRVRRHPNQRQSLEIGALIDELDLMREFYKWQIDALHCFGLTIKPETYPRKNKVQAERQKLFNMEKNILHSLNVKLDKNIQRLDGIAKRCKSMNEQVDKQTRIKSDDQSQVMFIFTTVTVVFLPLSFVASYVSMSGGTTGLDWNGLQGLFWKVAGPLTMVVIIFCLLVAQRRKLVKAVSESRPMKRILEWTSDKSGRASRTWEGLSGRLLQGRRYRGDANNDISNTTTAGRIAS